MARYIKTEALDAIKNCFVEDCFEANKDVAQLSAKEVEAEQKEFVRAYGLKLEEAFRHAYQYGWNNAIEMAKRDKDRVPSADVVEVVRCKDCRYMPTGDSANHDLEFPEDFKCPCQCDDFWYSWKPNDNWFCGNGKRRDDGRDKI